MNKIVRFDPFQDLERVRTQLSRAFDDGYYFPVVEGTNWQENGLIPAVDIYATNDELLVYVNLPGLSGEDVEVTTAKDTLTISGEYKPVTLPEGTACLRQEISTGKFKRTFRLPLPIQSDQVTASFKNGVLEIKLPKEEEIKSRTVKIDVH